MCSDHISTCQAAPRAWMLPGVGLQHEGVELAAPRGAALRAVLRMQHSARDQNACMQKQFHSINPNAQWCVSQSSTCAQTLRRSDARCLSVGPMAQRVVHALKGLPCRARVTPASLPRTTSSAQCSRRLRSTRVAASVLLAHAEVTENINTLSMGPNVGIHAGLTWPHERAQPTCNLPSDVVACAGRALPNIRELPFASQCAHRSDYFVHTRPQGGVERNHPSNQVEQSPRIPICSQLHSHN